MTERWDMLLAALVLAPFVALGAIIYAILRGIAHAWAMSRGVVRDLTMLGIEHEAAREIEEDREIRRSLAGKTWRDDAEGSR